MTDTNRPDWRVRDPNTGRFTSANAVAKQAINTYKAEQAGAGFTDELGIPGTRRGYTTLYEDFVTDLQGQRAVRTYREMRSNDAVVAGIMFAIETVLRELSWTVPPLSNDDPDLRAADLASSAMSDMAHTWDDHLAEVLDMLVFGFSWFNTVYKYRRGDKTDQPSEYADGMLGWDRFSYRDPSTLVRWELDGHNRVTGFVQAAPGAGTVTIPLDRSIYYRTVTTSPEGRSLLRGAYRAWWMKKNVEDITAIGIERDLVGLPVAKMPAESLLAKDATYDTVKKIVTRIRRHEQEGVIFPSDRDQSGNLLFDLDTIKSSGAAKVDPLAFIAAQAGDIAAVVLADFIRLGRDAVGSRALADPKQDLFRLAMDALADTIAATFNKQAVDPLMRLNGYQPPFPQLRHTSTTDYSLADIAALVKDTAQAGMPWFGIPNDTVEDRIREMAGFDPAPADDGQLALDVE
jgi:hypothetical protein